jgi:hypothetical protein
MTLRTTLGWKGEPEHPVAMMDFTTDRLILDHSAGWAVVQVSKVGDVVTVVWIRALSVNPVVREQFIEVRFLDDGRGTHHPLVIPGGLSSRVGMVRPHSLPGKTPLNLIRLCSPTLGWPTPTLGTNSPAHSALNPTPEQAP